MSHDIQRDGGGGVRNGRLSVERGIEGRQTGGGRGHHRTVGTGWRLESRLRETSGRGIGPSLNLLWFYLRARTGGELTAIARGRVLQLRRRGCWRWCGSDGGRDLLHGGGGGRFGGTGLRGTGVGGTRRRSSGLGGIRSLITRTRRLLRLTPLGPPVLEPNLKTEQKLIPEITFHLLLLRSHLLFESHQFLLHIHQHHCYKGC